ncbi:hypothetical protein SAMN02745945_01117 [Peptoclostridium litorale DSM 5388]|uniref:Uncharacterized protein n=1 Tax=Peptoclostridium litorale DSM 5388 TaxID=1121324 RepID=A0A069RCD9_PEPLI|nr:hypothetical protein [Peptoclostridium litorale]KDR93920.1 hypothetical protein CLIT_23c01920 [Peptoclostridium litorale DSM 5388]KDR95347.1 hypothetical protein CLIT_10c00740 [Peptoclostridium litorale DSM 5388]SIN88590.1 hypothetical protein SAMN02745945_01117 [Peptoclostridium litorale DSM 5388]
MKKKIDYLKQIYRFDKTRNTFIIEVSLDDYNEVFNGWDPSPFKKRDIEPDLKFFLEECSYDIPLKYELEIWFYMPEHMKDIKKERLTEAGIKNNFDFLTHIIGRELRSSKKKTIVYATMAFAFLFLAYSVQRNSISGKLLYSIMLEGVFIGGWVFLWEAFSIMFIVDQDVKKKLKEYKRFIRTNIEFKYVKKD